MCSLCGCIRTILAYVRVCMQAVREQLGPEDEETQLSVENYYRATADADRGAHTAVDTAYFASTAHWDQVIWPEVVRLYGLETSALLAVAEMQSDAPPLGPELRAVLERLDAGRGRLHAIGDDYGVVRLPVLDATCTRVHFVRPCFGR